MNVVGNLCFKQPQHQPHIYEYYCWLNILSAEIESIPFKACDRQDYSIFISHVCFYYRIFHDYSRSFHSIAITGPFNSDQSTSHLYLLCEAVKITKAIFISLQQWLIRKKIRFDCANSIRNMIHPFESVYYCYFVCVLGKALKIMNIR